MYVCTSSDDWPNEDIGIAIAANRNKAEILFLTDFDLINLERIVFWVMINSLFRLKIFNKSRFIALNELSPDSNQVTWLINQKNIFDNLYLY